MREYIKICDFAFLVANLMDNILHYINKQRQISIFQEKGKNLKQSNLN